MTIAPRHSAHPRPASRAARLGAVLWLAAAACRGPASFVHPNADLGAIKTVAVLPFENVTSDRVAPEKVQRIFITELLETGAFNVLEPGYVGRVLRDAKIESIASLSPEDVKELGKALKADGIFFGTVLDYSESKGSGVPAPEVTLQFKLVETGSGSTVWAITRTRSGANASARLFGIGGQSLTEVAEDLVKDSLGTLLR